MLASGLCTVPNRIALIPAGLLKRFFTADKRRMKPKSPDIGKELAKIPTTMFHPLKPPLLQGWPISPSKMIFG